MTSERKNESRTRGWKVLAGSLGITAALAVSAVPAQAAFTGPTTVCSPGPTPALTIKDASTSESWGLAVVEVHLLGKACWSVSVDYAAENVTAGNGSDFDLPPGKLTFKPGETAKYLHIKVANEGSPEGPEYFRINLSNPSGATVSDGSSTVYIYE